MNNRKASSGLVVAMDASQNRVFPQDSWQYRQFPNEKRTALNEGTKSSLECLLLPRLKHRKFNPMGYHLAQIDWSVFGTGTFEDNKFTKNTTESENLRQFEFFNLLRSVCIRHDLRMRNLVYFGKTEWGANRRGHFNFLIGRRGTEKVSSDILAASLQEFWTTGDRRKGMAKIEPFNACWHLEGVLYQSKYEYDSRGEWIPPNEIKSPMLNKLIQKNIQNN